MAKVMVIGALPESLTNFRGDLIRSLVEAGHQVTAMATPASQEQVDAIKALGADFRSFPVQRNGLNPIQDLKTLFSLWRVFRELKPDVVLAYTIKPVIWGGIALRGDRNARFVALITGLGFAFQGKGRLRGALTNAVSSLYRLALGRSLAVVFQNHDDREHFVARRIASPAICNVVGGSGVHLDRFGLRPLAAQGTVFLMVARLLREKGVREYAEAARQVKVRYPEAVFQLLGPEDPSPDGIPINEVQKWQSAGHVEYFGAVSDVRPFLENCHVFVLPSYYGEGLPRTIIEAMATGRPILTTDNVGCRETVISGENGYLVPKANAEALAERMIWFIEHRDQWERMGQKSRQLAEERFDVHKVNRQLIQIMGLEPS